MPNIIKGFGFSGMLNQTSPNSVLEFVDGNENHVRVHKPSDAAPTSLSWRVNNIDFGQTYEATVLAKKISGNPRIWFVQRDSVGNNIYSGNNFDYIELDLDDDWKLYKLQIQLSNRRTKYLELHFGFWTTLFGEAEFKEPNLQLIQANYSSFLQPLIIAQGILGYDRNTERWGNFKTGNHNRSILHGIESVEWDKSEKMMIVNLSNKNIILEENRPTPTFSLFSKSTVTSNVIAPILYSITERSLLFYFIDSNNNKVDPEDTHESALITLVVFA